MPYVIKRRSTYLIPPGSHEVTICAIKQEVSSYDKNKDIPIVELEKYDRGIRRTLNVFGSATLSPDSTFFEVIEAAMDRPLTADEFENGFDLDQIKGKTIRIFVQDLPNKSGKVGPRVIRASSVGSRNL